MHNNMYDLTNPQKSIWFTEQFYSGTSIGNITSAVTINQEVDIKLLEKTANLLVESNDNFRLKFIQTENGPKQYIAEFKPFSIEIVNLSSPKDVEILERKMSEEPFSLLDSYLFLFKIFKLPNGFGGLSLNMHHLISDAWTEGLIVDEIINIYSKLLEQSNEPITTSSYKDYIFSENEYLKSEKFLKDKLFWNEQYKQIPELASIPSLHAISNSNSCEAKRKVFDIPSETLNLINEFSKKYKASPFNFFIGIISLYLGRVSNLEEFVIGSPILNRSNFKDKHTMGMFISTIPFKISLNQDITFSNFISKIATDFFDIFRHQKYPYQYLLEDLRKENSSLPNLYDILISYQNMRTQKQTSNISFNSSWINPNYISDSLDIHIFDIDDTGTLNIAYDYQTAKYSIDDICSIHARILNIINQVLNNEELLLSDIEIVTPDEKQKLLYDFNNTAMDYPKDKTLSQLFEDQVEKTPNNIAVVFEDKKLTYKELNEKANSLANHLRTNGIKRNDIIGIMVNRSLEMIVSILAVLKSGACYIPIDPEYPQDRIEYMLDNSNSKFLLTFKTLKDKVEFDNKIFVELENDIYSDNSSKNLKNINDPEDLAYIIYTSGSTGKPKGVMLKHQNIVNFIYGTSSIIDFNCNKTIVSVTTISFDIFVLESLLPLLNGLKIVVANENEQNSIVDFNRLCIKHNVNIIQTTPSRFQALISDSLSLEYMKNITDILVGGEPFPDLLLNKLKQISTANIYNMYGPTETAVWSSIKNLTESKKITIGNPISNTQMYILDKNCNLLPTNIPGDLYIAGDGVSNGYLNRPNLTSEKFITNRFTNNLMYNTGDLAYFDDNGEIIHLGRSDFQVKIRGYRVELGEIERNISLFAGINQNIVTCKDNKYLICYYTSSESIDTAKLVSFLLSNLPNYMIPAHFEKLDTFPYTPNGKIDRKKLPIPKIEQNKEIILARNNIDSTLLDLCENILDITNISIADNFFYLGGDSLSAINLSSKIYNKLNINVTVKDILENPIIQDLSDLIADKCKNTENNITISISKTANNSSYVTSSAQKRTYYASSLSGENSILYNIPGGVILDKLPNIAKLEKCINTLIERHESLRTYFEIENNEVVQKIQNKIDFNLDVTNNIIESENLNLEFKSFVKSFDLSRAPLFRAKLIKLPQSKCALFVDMHHIISDGTSLTIFINELCDLYNNKNLEPLTITYKDFANWEQKRLTSNDFINAENYWVNQFNTDVPVLNMPTVYQRQAVKSYDGNKLHTTISNETTNKINNICKELGTTPYMLLLSVYYVLLSKYTGQDDIIVGSPIVGRDMSELYNIIGMFVNSLPVRAKLDQSASFKEFLATVKNKCLENYNYQDYPFDELVNKLNLQRDTSRNPLFDTMFIYQNNGNTAVNFDGINAKYYIPDTNISKFDISLEIIPENDILNMSFEYCTKLFNKAFIEDFANHYLNILNVILDNLDIKLSKICMLSEQEKNKILYEFNNTDMDYPKDKTISQLFEEQVEKTPNNIAVVFEDKKLTYKELNEKSNSLANYLRTNGIKRNDIVGIMVNRSLEMIVSILAVLKSGACYIPIDPEYPQDRIEYMLDNSNSKFLLTFKTLKDKVEFDNKIFVELENDLYSNNNSKNLKNINDPEDLAYIIYTSGSTGNPKGVMLKHASLSNLASYLSRHVEFLKDDLIQKTIVSVTTVSFDIFIFETIICLQKGLKLIIANEEEQHIPSKLIALIKEEKIDAVQMTPSRMQIFLDNIESNSLFSLKYVVLAGEPLPDKLLLQLLNKNIQKVYNGYGPSETTVFSTFTDVTNSKKITIGIPIDNTKMYVLDKNMHICPINVPGELYISGDGVGKGYLNNSELTDKSYILNPFNPKTLMYKTGDLCVLSRNYDLEYLSRIDNQVKIRGLRIELGEIESKILSYSGISKACVIKQTINTRDFISAYYIQEKRINISNLRKYLSKYLPKYMIPAYFTVLDKFPCTPNGKINKKELPLPKEILNGNNSNTYVAPKTNLEKQIVSIWENILNINPIGIQDNFFDLGGDSILAMNLNIELRKISDSISYADIFKFPTISDLIKKMNSTDENYDFKYMEKSYDKYTSILELNKKTPSIFSLKYVTPSNIILTGATGFLGIHIISEFIKKEKGVIYCIIREEPGLTAQAKLHQKLNYYFGNKYDKLIGNRIIAVTGDICKPGFGLNQEDLLSIANNANIVVNTAAKVTHFGNYSEFYNVNVKSVKYLLEFCKSFNKKLYHISTLSVSGNSFDSSIIKQNVATTTYFNEASLYIGQSLENVYVKSKFEAECLILDAILDGLDAYILRVGNLMPRLKDGVFQENILENAFINRIISFVKIGVLPDSIMSKYLEFTPIDVISNAIIKLITHPNKNNKIFHLFNNNHIYIDKCMQYFKSLNPDLTIISDKEFKFVINKLLNDKTKKDNLGLLINDMDKNLNLNYESNIIIKSNFTIKYLSKLGFSWPKISEKYLLKFISLLKKVL